MKRQKTGGRKAGTPNKATATLKEFITLIINENRSQMEKDLKELEPKERLQILVKMMAFVMPKQVSFEEGFLDHNITIGYVETGIEPVDSEDLIT